jgi:putative oxidoreductase
MPTNLDARLDPHAPAVLSLFRVIVALVLLTHATAHLFGWPTGTAAPVGSWPYWCAGVLEIVTGILIALGLFTRIAAFVASGVMAFAYFTQHMPNSFWPIVNKGESAVLLCFAFFLLVFTGGGAVALDARRRRR